jgi:tetratricopeptide (TPR) repeat protein
MVRRFNPGDFSLSRTKAAKLAAARARRVAAPPGKQRTGWELGELYWARFTKVALNAVAILVAGFLLYFLWHVSKNVISIAPLSVPQVLAANGYTGDVAAERLKGALDDIVNRAHSMPGEPDFAMQIDLPSIVVPSTTLSSEALAAKIRRFFRIDGRWNVSGEITIVENKLWLRLRMNERDLYESASGVDPEHPDGLFAAAAQRIFEETDPYILAASLSDTDLGKSLEIAKRIMDRPGKDPAISRAHNLTGNILYDQHKFNEAIAEYRKAIELDPLYANPHNGLGLTLSDQDSTEKAIAEFRKAIELDPLYAKPHNNLGNVLSAQAKTEEAIAEYRKAIELDPLDARPHNALGKVLSAQGKTEEAIAEYRKGIELDPRIASARNALGNTLSDQGKIEDAIAEYRNAIKLDPLYAHAYHNLGNALSVQGKTEEAIAEYRKAIELDPLYGHPHVGLGNILSARGKTEEAIAEYRNALELDPSNAQARNKLGNALSVQGKTDEAIAEYRKAIELDPRDANAHRNLSAALGQQGKNDAASAELEKALALERKR